MQELVFFFICNVYHTPILNDRRGNMANEWKSAVTSLCSGRPDTSLSLKLKFT